jgi:predicted dehydrogenase
VVNVGIIGAGYIAASHADAYAVHPDARVVCVADPVVDKAQALARRHGAVAVPDVETLLDADLDVVSVCTPSPTHASLAVAALAAGKHVLCEKPLARSLVDARHIVEAARRGPGLLMVGHVSRFEPDHRAAFDTVAAGHLGQVRMMSQSITGELPTWSQGGWLTDPAQSGGPLVDLAIHSFDYLTWLCGARPERVHAVGSARQDGLVDYAIATVRYDTGALAVVETSWAHPPGHGLSVATEVAGSLGRLTWDYAGASVGTVNRLGHPSRQLSQLGNRGFESQIAALLSAVASGGPSPVPAEEGLLALQTSLAAEESLRTRTAVRLPPADRLEERS